MKYSPTLFFIILPKGVTQNKHNNKQDNYMVPSDDGFYKRAASSTSYVTILGIEDDKGKPAAVFAEKVNEGDEGAISRVNKNKKTVWERHHDAMNVTIKAVYVKHDKEYGDQLCIRGKSKTVQVAFNSAHAKKFIAVCHNINLDEPIYLEPYKFAKVDSNDRPVVDGRGNPKFNTGWTIKQGGTKKEHKLEDSLDMSKDGPVPAFEKLKNGKWDTSDHDAYLMEYLEKWIKENELDTKPESSKDTDDDDDDEEDEEEDDDDDADDEEDDAPPIKKAKAKVIASKPLDKKKKKKKAVTEDDDEEEDGVPF